MYNFNLHQNEITKAEELISKGNDYAKNCPARPRFHFVSPTYMLIDVWGAIFHQNYYHLFFDLNYNNDPKKLGGAFGHIRSNDLLHWERLPMALLPQEDKGEFGLNDGTVVIDSNGEPLMYYTRCFTDFSCHREHVAVRGSNDLTDWVRMSDNKGTLNIKNHGGPMFTTEWSDPLIFREAGRTFMIISKCFTLDNKGMIPIYEATDDTMLSWEYKGVFAEHTGEVLNFIKIGEKWVLVYSPYNNPCYFVGSFDLETLKFKEETNGILSYGYVQQGHESERVSRGFYATAAFYDKENTATLFGWISDFGGNGWDGCVSLPRKLTVNSENKLLMTPADVLNSLRKEKLLPNNKNEIICGQCFELKLSAVGNFELSIDNSFNLSVNENEIVFNDIKVPYIKEEKISIRMFVDVSLAEIFVDNGKISISRCFPYIRDENALLKLKSKGQIIEFSAYKCSL